MSASPDSPPRPDSKRATIRDVAEKAGVSKSLVSLVYANPASVSSDRTARVLAAAAELGFRPNAVARSLAGGGGDFVAILMADLHNPVFADIVDAARAELAVIGHGSVITSATLVRPGQAPELDGRLIAIMRDLRPRGVLVVGSLPDMDLIAEIGGGSRIVVASAIAEGIPETPTVRGDDLVGMALVVDHLVALGHHDIAHVGGGGGAVSLARARAYEAAMRSHGLDEFIRVEGADFSEQAGYEAARRLLNSRGSLPTAITAVNDLSAVGVLAATAAEREGADGFTSVTGYDDTFLSGLRQVALTTVDPGNREIGRRAALLFSSDQRSVTGEILVRPRLAIRSSTAAPRR